MIFTTNPNSTMKKRFLNKMVFSCLLMLFFAASGYSQSYKTIDDAVANYPKSFASPEKTRGENQNRFHDRRRKKRALFSLGLRSTFVMILKHSNRN